MNDPVRTDVLSQLVELVRNSRAASDAADRASAAARSADPANVQPLSDYQRERLRTVTAEATLVAGALTLDLGHAVGG